MCTTLRAWEWRRLLAGKPAKIPPEACAAVVSWQLVSSTTDTVSANAGSLGRRHINYEARMARTSGSRPNGTPVPNQ